MIKKSFLISIIATSLLWISFSLIVIFVPIKEKEKKEEFVTVQLKIPTKEKTPEVIEPKIKEVEETINTKPVETTEKVESPKNPEIIEKSLVEEPVKPTKNEPIKSEPVKQQEELQNQVPLSKSMEELIAEQEAQVNKKNLDDVDWETIGDNSIQEFSSETSEKIENPTQIGADTSFSGSAGTTSNTIDTSVKSETETYRGEEVATNTKNILENIGTKKYESQADNLNATAEIETAESSSGTYFILNDKTKRRIITSCEIVLPKDAKIERQEVKTTITFTITKDGDVPYSEIKISEEALLSQEIINAIKKSVSTWRFEKANSNGQGSFNYSIVTK